MEKKKEKKGGYKKKRYSFSLPSDKILITFFFYTLKINNKLSPLLKFHFLQKQNHIYFIFVILKIIKKNVPNLISDSMTPLSFFDDIYYLLLFGSTGTL